MTNYFQKYLKYKNKYLELKGGSKSLQLLSFEAIIKPFHISSYDNFILFYNNNEELIATINPKIISEYLDNESFFIDKLEQLLWLSEKNIHLTHLTFGYHFNQPIGKDVLPKYLTHLTFGYTFNQPIGKDVLPKNLTHLTFGKSFNQIIKQDILPTSLTHLTFGWFFTNYNQPIEEGVLPNTLTELTFDYHFENGNKPIEKGVLPEYLTHLTFGDNFNNGDQPIGEGVLPNTLTHLTFGKYFRNGIMQHMEKNVLPQKLTHLTLGMWFNRIIEHKVLPNTLTHLDLSNTDLRPGNHDQYFDKELQGRLDKFIVEKNSLLPASLTHLRLPYKHWLKLPTEIQEKYTRY